MLWESLWLWRIRQGTQECFSFEDYFWKKRPFTWHFSSNDAPVLVKRRESIIVNGALKLWSFSKDRLSPCVDGEDWFSTKNLSPSVSYDGPLRFAFLYIPLSLDSIQECFKTHAPIFKVDRHMGTVLDEIFDVRVDRVYIVSTYFDAFWLLPVIAFHDHSMSKCMDDGCAKCAGAPPTQEALSGFFGITL